MTHNNNLHMSNKLPTNKWKQTLNLFKVYLLLRFNIWRRRHYNSSWNTLSCSSVPHQKQHTPRLHSRSDSTQSSPASHYHVQQYPQRPSSRQDRYWDALHLISYLQTQLYRRLINYLNQEFINLIHWLTVWELAGWRKTGITCLEGYPSIKHEIDLSSLIQLLTELSFECWSFRAKRGPLSFVNAGMLKTFR